MAGVRIKDDMMVGWEGAGRQSDRQNKRGGGKEDREGRK